MVSVILMVGLSILLSVVVSGYAFELIDRMFASPVDADTTIEVNNDTSVESSVPHSVDRFVDTEAGVVYYKFDDYQEGGISCVPVNSTALNITK